MKHISGIPNTKRIPTIILKIYMMTLIALISTNLNAKEVKAPQIIKLTKPAHALWKKPTKDNQIKENQNNQKNKRSQTNHKSQKLSQSSQKNSNQNKQETKKQKPQQAWLKTAHLNGRTKNLSQDATSTKSHQSKNKKKNTSQKKSKARQVCLLEEENKQLNKKRDQYLLLAEELKQANQALAQNVLLLKHEITGSQDQQLQSKDVKI